MSVRHSPACTDWRYAHLCRKGKDGKVIPGPRYPVPLVGGLVQMVMDPFAFWEQQRKCAHMKCCQSTCSRQCTADVQLGVALAPAVPRLPLHPTSVSMTVRKRSCDNECELVVSCHAAVLSAPSVFALTI